MLQGPQSWTVPWGERIALELPPDALSVTLMAVGEPIDTLSLGISAGERVLVEPATPESSLNRLLRARGVVVGALPSSGAALPLERAYQLTPVALQPAAPGNLAVSAWVKRGLTGPAVPAVQELALTVVLAGTEAPAGLDAALAGLTDIWRRAGIEVRPAMRVRVSGPALVEVDPLRGSDTLAVGEALRLSAAAPAGTLALVVVGDLALSGSDLALWALSGTIPVPPVLGTPRSGVLASGAFLGRDPAFAGQILAHEIGHALGLYHTTERQVTGDGATHDQLHDTAACPASADRDGDRFLDGRECAGHDAGNLMFWGTARGATALTPAQAEMARRSPLVR